MRARFLRSGSRSFADHELLELLLFYSLPRENTNGLAHELIERFGSMHKLASASIDELMMIDGVGENTAILIKLVMALAQRYSLEELEPLKRFDSIEKAVSYAKGIFLGSNTETLYLVLLDNSFCLLDCVCVSFGSINEVRPIIRNIIERSIIKRASSVLLLHNHPDGIAEPPENDVRFSQLVDHELNIVGINLVEHIIVSQNKYFPVMRSIRKEIDIPCFKEFYKS